MNTVYTQSPFQVRATLARNVLDTLEAENVRAFEICEWMLLARLTLDKEIPAGYGSHIETGCAEHGVVHVYCSGANDHLWLEVDPTTGVVRVL